MKARQKHHKCPKYYAGYPALLRRDNKTKICPEYGIKEALETCLCHRRDLRQ